MKTTYLKYFLAVFAAAALFAGCEPNCDPTLSDPNPDPTPPAPPTPAYKVGDLYTKGFVKGIVVSVDETGEHGLLVSLNQCEEVWSYKVEEAMGSLPGSGAYNTSCVQKLHDWKEYYPAFVEATKDNVGALKNWFLPSMNELAKLYGAYTGHETNDTEGGTGSLNSIRSPKAGPETASASSEEQQRKDFFNKCLTDNGGDAMEDKVYWSSSENGPSIVFAFDMGTGKSIDTPSDLDKRAKHMVRAMASF